MKLVSGCLLSSLFLLTLNCTTTSLGDSLNLKDYSMLQAYKKAYDLSGQNLFLQDASNRVQSADENRQSCQSFLQLSQQDFILKNLSFLQAYLTCDLFETPVPFRTIDLSAEPWLKELYLKAQFKQAELNNDLLLKAALLNEKAKSSSRITEKVDFYQKSVSIYQQQKDFKKAEEVQLDLYQIAPHLMIKPLKSDWFRIGKSLMQVRKFPQGRKYFKLMLKDSYFQFEDQFRARVEIRDSYKVERNMLQHLAEAQRLVVFLDKKKDLKKLLDASVFYARALWTEGQVQQAQKILFQTEKKLKNKLPIGMVYWVLGRIQEEKKNYQQAILYYDKGLQEKPDPALEEQLLYYKAWSLRKTKQYQQAIPLFEKIASQTTNDKSRFLFWQAQSLKQSGDQSGAQKLFESLSEEDVLGYYGLLSFRELKKDFPPLLVKSSLIRHPSINLEIQKTIEALSFVGQRDVLEKYLYAHTHRSDFKQDPESWLYFLKAYAQAGLYIRLFAEIPKLSPDVRKKILLQHPELIFPQDYLSYIETVSQKFSVPAELILSIIRQESSFDPYARSPADALGLMQLLPSLAVDLKPETQIQIQNFEELYNPFTNITLGTALLSKLMRKYQNQFLLTAASYNANEKAIRTWVQTRFDGDVLEFIEDVPYSETRGYMKLVLRNFIFYSRLKNPNQPLPFPEWCLDNLQAFKNLTSKVSVSQ